MTDDNKNDGNKVNSFEKLRRSLGISQENMNDVFTDVVRARSEKPTRRNTDKNEPYQIPDLDEIRRPKEKPKENDSELDM